MFWRFACQRFFLTLFLISTIHGQTTSPSGQHWDYQREGPDAWHHLYDECEGEAQSPIDIRTSYVKHDSNLHDLSLNGYTSNVSSYAWNFTHNGHTIVAYPPPLARISISGGGLPEVFYLIQFHLHWGYNAYQGSEHTINGLKYPLEVHFVHRAQFGNTLAVLGILFHRERDDNPHLNDFLSVINRTSNTNVSFEQQINLTRLLPTSPISRFYRYNGSLTTPPCSEGVIWTILARTVPISSYQLRVFENNMVPFNFRPTQKLNSRKVYAGFQPEYYQGAAEEEGGHGGEGGGHSSATSIQMKSIHLFLSLCISLKVFS